MHFLYAILIVTVIKTGYCNVLVRQTRDADSWSYDGDNGPKNWPGLCQTGKRQSPIDIGGPKKPLIGLPLAVEGAYNRETELKSSWNGHAYTAEFSKSWQFGFIAGGSLQDVYIFKSLHVHWGSEHTINNQRYSAEMHLVHYNAKYTPDEAGDKKDGLAVIGILLQEEEDEDDSSSAMNEFLESLVHANQTFKARLRDIFPAHIEPWVRYQGSLTTPGCSENVKWTVLEEAVSIRKGIIKRGVEHFEQSYRPIQEINDRTIYASISLSFPSINNIDKNTANSKVINQILFIFVVNMQKGAKTENCFICLKTPF